MACGGGINKTEGLIKNKKLSSASKASNDILELPNGLKEKNSFTDNSKDNSSLKMKFKNEDEVIAKLYRKVVDDIMAHNRLEEKIVNGAIFRMKQEISVGHKKAYSRFLGIDFCKPEDQCGYLRRYAICFTGLIKKAVWQFLNAQAFCCKKARSDILNSNIQRVVSLGGGPGHDLIGFCSALQETPNNIKKLDLKIVDMREGWTSTFPAILKKAYRAEFGSLSALMNKVIISTGFLHKSLTKSRAFKDPNLSTIVGEADVILMANVASFMSDRDVEKLTQNVAVCMKEGAYLIFIDYEIDGTFFKRIQCLDFIYEKMSLTYKLSYDPRKSLTKSIKKYEGNICIFRKQPEDLTSK